MRRVSGLLAVLALIFCVLPHVVLAGGKPAVTGVRAAAHDGITRFVMDVTDSVPFLVGTEAGHIVVEVPDLEWRTNGKGQSRGVGVLKDWSYGPGRSGHGRLTLSTDSSAGVQKSFVIPPSGNAGYRLVIDLATGAPKPAALASQSFPTSAPVLASPSATAAPTKAVPSDDDAPPPAMAQNQMPQAQSPASVQSQSSQTVQVQPTPQAVPQSAAAASGVAVPVEAPSTEGFLRHTIPSNATTANPGGTKVATGPLPKPLPPRQAQAQASEPAAVLSPPLSDNSAKPSGVSGKPVVVIDPGHGGPDPGAISLTGAYEKNIVLALGLEVRDILNRNGKVRCVLTRDGDYFIPLRERVAIARAAHADLFMSLHADTVKDAAIRGLSVYTLSQNASDAEAQALADKENKSDIVAGIDLSNETAEVTNILIDLVQRESMNKSAVFATNIIRSVQSETHNVLETNTHRFAGFAVLKAPDIPSVLVENGYLSNVTDEQMLRQGEYRAKLATALAKAIENYFAQSKRSKKS